MAAFVDLKPCSICGRPYLGEDPNFCSPDCRTVEMLVRENLKASFDHNPTGDPRTFFYDAPMASLVDQYLVFSLKRIHAKDVRQQQELDFHMARLRRCIETKVCVRNPLQAERAALWTLTKALMVVHAKGWFLQTMIHNKAVAEPECHALAYQLVQLGDRRHSILQQIDLLVAGRTTAWRYY